MAEANALAQSSRRQVLSAGLASLLGWSFDLFDLFIILYVAPTISPLFFPSNIPTLSLAAVYASFAVTLLMRPIGSAIFGAYADRHGRRQTMIVTVFGVGIATAALGILPTIQKVGLIAPVLFIVLRLVQGIFVGGVVASTHTIGTETVGPKWRGLMSGLVGAGGAGLGALFASIAFSIISALFPGEAFVSWGWRLMFFSGILASLLSFFIFRSVEESPLWLQLDRSRKQTPQTPLRTLFSSKYRRILLLNLLIVAGGGTQYYLTSGYLPTFLTLINGIPRTQSGQILIAGSLVVVLASILVGHLSEIIGRKKTFIIMGVINLFAIPATYWLLAHTNKAEIGKILIGVVLLSFLGNAAYAPVLVFLNERFPTAIRASGTALSWNLGFALGGMTPTFATGLAGQVSNIPFSITLFLIGAILIYLLGAVLTPETKGQFS